MKALALIILVSLLFLVPAGAPLDESQPKYVIQIRSDGSATWLVSQTLGINASLETLEEFQNRITLLVEASINRTGRDMIAEVDSLTFTPSGSYIEVERQFQWENFSKVGDSQIVIGDVFRVSGFFLQLYGDGEVQMIYPPLYNVETVLPAPSSQDDSSQSLSWLGTNDFTEGTMIVLREGSGNSGVMAELTQNALLVVGLAATAVGFSVGFYTLRLRKKKRTSTSGVSEIPKSLGIESGEEKAVKLIKLSGGSLLQSVITDQCGFSKAKTSQLLSILEHKGVVRRYKKGRDKVVVLVKQEKSGDQ